MGRFHSPKIVTDGLVLCLDAANKKSYDGTTNVWSDMIRSFSSNVATTIIDNTQTEISGETTVNLMYSSNNTGQFLGTISNSVGQFTIETIEANNRYRLTCTANSNFRILIPDGLLANGQTYSMSLKTNNPKMGINDFCDNAVTRVSVDFGTYYYLSATGSRTTYDSTYRFFDSVSNFVIGDVIDLWDIQVEQKPYSTVFVNGVRSANTTPVDFPGTYTFPFSSEAGGCFDFDGVEDRTSFTGIIPISNNSIFGFTGIPTASKTITVAFKTGFDVTKRQAIYSQGANARGYNIYIKNGNLYAGAYNNTLFDYGYQWPGNWATYAIQTNTWYHVTLVQRDATNILENDKLELYINGNLVSKVPGAKVGVHSILSLGGFISSAVLTDDGIMFPNSYSLEGKIALVKQYNRALSAAEIQQNFNALRGRFGI